MKVKVDELVGGQAPVRKEFVGNVDKGGPFVDRVGDGSDSHYIGYHVPGAYVELQLSPSELLVLRSELNKVTVP